MVLLTSVLRVYDTCYLTLCMVVKRSCEERNRWEGIREERNKWEI